MTRKDTILAAALVNAGLLVVLFISALKNEEKAEGIVSEKASVDLPVVQKPFVAEPKKSSEPDEVDMLLKQYAGKQVEVEPLKEPPAGSEPAVVTELASQESVKDKSEVKYIEVKVKKGDMLEKIARSHKTTVSEIMKTNGLSSASLKIGQVLKVPVSEEKAVTAVAVKAPLEPTSAKHYTIKPGDNLWTIAVRNHMKVEDLLKLNGLTEEKAKKLKPGDTVRTR